VAENRAAVVAVVEGAGSPIGVSIRRGLNMPQGVAVLRIPAVDRVRRQSPSRQAKTDRILRTTVLRASGRYRHRLWSPVSEAVPSREGPRTPGSSLLPWVRALVSHSHLAMGGHRARCQPRVLVSVPSSLPSPRSRCRAAHGQRGGRRCLPHVFRRKKVTKPLLARGRN
jgi:hypothetical protein